MRGIVRTIAAALALAAFAWLNTVAEAATAGSSASPVASQAPLSDLGIVLLHGKQGAGGRGNIASLAGALVAAGYRVESPDMCWARPRIYDAPFPECLREIDAAIAALHAAGARRIVVAGQSLGGMATLVYAANHPEVNGAMAFAPAGRPQSLAHNASVAASIAKAQQMLAAHQDAERAGFTDVNNGKTFPVTTTPAIFLSFAGPGAQTDFVAVLPRIRVPLLWVAGLDDRSQDRAREWFRLVPSNPLLRFVEVQADHMETPRAGTAVALEWLKALPAP